MLVKNSENNGKNISKNLDLEQNINFFCLFIWSTYVQGKQVFDNFMIILRDKTENSL